MESTPFGVTGQPISVTSEVTSEVSLTSEVTSNASLDGNNTAGEGHYYFQRERIIFDSCLLAAIIVGNLIVLVAVRLPGTRRTRMTFFIMQLAIADLMVGLCSVVPDLSFNIHERWGGGDPICKIVKYLQGVVTYGSTYILVALSIDRLDAIARPLGGFSNRHWCKVLTISAWAVASLFASPMFLFQDINGECLINLTEVQWQIYIVLIAVAVFFIPTIIITFCYGAIIYKLCSRNEQFLYSTNVKEESDDLYPKNGFKTHRSPRPNRKTRQKEKQRRNRGIIPKARIRTIKMTLVIVIVFILCWSPYFIVNIMAVFGHLSFDNQLVIGIYGFIQSLAPLNSAANPVIYGIFSARSCKNLRSYEILDTILKCFGCCQERRQRLREKRRSTTVTMSCTDTTYAPCITQNITPDKSMDIIKPSDSTEMCDLVASCDPNIEPSR